MIVLLLLMNWSESQAWEPRWYPAGAKIIPDGSSRADGSRKIGCE